MDHKLPFHKVLKMKDILAIAFGAMIGWSWVINTGDWVLEAGYLGASIAFLVGGIMIIFVGLTYAELTAAIPECGGEHIFCLRALGGNASFICSWAIIFSYIATAAFEAAAFPAVIKYIVGERFDIGLLYHIGDTPIYASYCITGVVFSLLITYVNIRGIEVAAKLQKVLTSIILLTGALLILIAVLRGNPMNLASNLFGAQNSVSSPKSVLGSILTITCMTPCLFAGFDIIPQTAGEIIVSFRKIGKVMVLSICLAIAWYLLIIFGVSNILPLSAIADSMENGLVTADAMALAFASPVMGDVLIIGGMCGIITSWNAFLLGGSRALFSLADYGMIPTVFGKIHSKYNTPWAAICLCGAACIISPFFGRSVLIPLVNVASFGCCIAYFMVSVSFLTLRKKEPHLHRPYRVRHGSFVGYTACILTACMLLLYIVPVPFAQSALIWQEWAIVFLWMILGCFFYSASKCTAFSLT
ncbi:MAG: APC family permease [Hespellia sp.]|nr:APC family permease [Hespellia sp.]